MTGAAAPRLLVTRPWHQGEALARALRRLGWACTIEPMLRIVDTVPAALPEMRPQAFVVTSRNAVLALALAARRYPGTTRVVAVGPDTAAAVRDAGFEEVLVGRGTAESVTATILERLRPGEGPVLHLSGHDVAGDMPGQLRAHGFEMRRLPVYRAEPRTSLSPRCRQRLAAGELAAVTLFSPRTAATFAALVEKAGLKSSLANVAALAISDNAAAAAGSGWKQIRVAAEPSRQAMLALAKAHHPG